jgi:microcystin degradation protein MlrC
MSSTDFKPRIFVCGIATETHGFNKYPTTLEAFTEKGLFFVPEHGDLQQFRDSDHYFAGYLDVAEVEGWELVVGVCAFAWPAGPVSEHAFESLWARIEKQLLTEGPFDGLLLPLHGGMACEHLDDPEGEFVRRIRQRLGRDVPLAVNLDPHANLSPQFVRDCDIICGFHTTPHTDIRAASLRSATLLARTLKGEIKPHCCSIHPPMITGLDHGRTLAEASPMRSLLERVRQLQADDPQLLDASFMASFPHADQTWTGPSAVLVMDGESDRADAYLNELGEEIWRTRDVLTIDIVSIDEALDAVEATAAQAQPFLLGDFSDCPYAGGYGDSTAMLQALIARRVAGAVFGPLFDRAAVEQAHAAGVGAEIEVSLGGKCDPRFGGGPVTGVATVRALSDGKFVHRGPYLQGQAGDLGNSALLNIEGVDVIVNSFPSQIHDREQLKLFGIVAEEMNVIVSKAFNHMRADLQPISRGLLYPDAGGIFSFNFQQFSWRKIRRPIWPLDDIEIDVAEMDRS